MGPKLNLIPKQCQLQSHRRVKMRSRMRLLPINVWWCQWRVNRRIKEGTQRQKLVSDYCFVTILVYAQVWHPWFSHPTKTHLAITIFPFQSHSYTPPPIRTYWFLIALPFFFGPGFIFTQKCINPMHLFWEVSISCLLLYMLTLLVVGSFGGLSGTPSLHYLPFTNQFILMLSLYLFFLSLFLFLLIFQCATIWEPGV